jgi:hypothetical protein
MNLALRAKQVKTIRNIQQKLKGYLLWKKCRSKADFFTRTDLDNHIFHLEIIIDTTQEPKISIKANKLLKLFKRILKYEYDEVPRKQIQKLNKNSNTKC